MDVVEEVPRTQGNDTMVCKNCLGLRFQEKKLDDDTTSGRYINHEFC